MRHIRAPRGLVETPTNRGCQTLRKPDQSAQRIVLNGEGLQHEDGHSLLLASTFPSIHPHDISFGFELASIINDGMCRMYTEGGNIYYSITLQNEDYVMPPMPAGVEESILKGMYPHVKADKPAAKHVQLFGGGCIMLQVQRAAEILKERYGVTSDIWE